MKYSRQMRYYGDTSQKMYVPSIIYSHNPEVQIMHYFIHKRTPTCKCFSAVMNFTIINIIKIDSNEIQATT